MLEWPLQAHHSEVLDLWDLKKFAPTASRETPKMLPSVRNAVQN